MQNSVNGYSEFFEKATGFRPFAFQEKLADSLLETDILRVPTGAGKTASVIVSWLFNRIKNPDKTPRRLIYCLPMRVLVEQTHAETEKFIKKLELTDKIGLSLWMGGERERGWEIEPETEQIIIGTQDMLVSSQLNRGFGATPARWPLLYGMLNNDCLWIMDEVQLMGSSLTTSAQLSAFHKNFRTLVSKKTLWMSATLRQEWLQTVDNKSVLESLEITGDDRNNESLHIRLKAPKSVESKQLDNDKKNHPKEIAELVKERATTLENNGLILVVLNQVSRAIETHKILDNLFSGKKSNQKNPSDLFSPEQKPDIVLLHSHFRPEDRKRLVDEKVKSPENGLRIIVSTQVIEAGVDISSDVLISDLAPWSSMVQRLGRLNRTGKKDNSEFIWLDPGNDEQIAKIALPYTKEELIASRNEFLKLSDASPDSLEEHLKNLSE
jgi:CRISPR-associated endonuclease/helicase Cas3